MTAAFSSILVVEDQAEVRQWLHALLRQHFPQAQIEEAGGFHEAQRRLSNKHWDIALIDIGLPDGCGIDLIKLISDTHPQTQSIVTTIYDDEAHLFNAIAAGAQGYLLKGQTEDALLHHLRQIQEGIPALSPSMARKMMAYFRDRPLPSIESDSSKTTLTKRETDVLSYIGKGLRAAEIAKLLGLTENTVYGYIKLIYRKLNISSRAEAAIEASRRGLI